MKTNLETVSEDLNILSDMLQWHDLQETGDSALNAYRAVLFLVKDASGRLKASADIPEAICLEILTDLTLLRNHVEKFKSLVVRIAHGAEQHGMNDAAYERFFVDKTKEMLRQAHDQFGEKLSRFSIKVGLLETMPSEGFNQPVSVKGVDEIPADYREGGKLSGVPLTTDHLKENPEWNLRPDYVSRNYAADGTKRLTKRLHWGKKRVYLYTELAALRRSKTESEKYDRPEEIAKRWDEARSRKVGEQR